MEIKVEKYNDIWLDNGLATFYEILKACEEDVLDVIDLNTNQLSYRFEDVNTFIEELADVIKNKLNGMVVHVEDKKTGERKEVKKDHILIQEGKKIGGKVAFKERIFDKKSTEDVLEEVYQNLDGTKQTCFFCNRQFKKNVKKLQQASYPFVTKIASLSGIRSGESIKLTEYISEYCPQCYLNGILVWLDESMVYRTIPTKKSIIILPNMDNLSNLIELKNSYKGILNNEERWCNIKIDIDKPDVDKSPSGKYSTFMSFYENFIRVISRDFENINWYIIEIPQSGSVKNPKYFDITLDKAISQMIKKLTRQESAYFYRVFVKQFYTFYIDPKKGIRDFDREKVLHEQLCRALIENDFELFAKTFVPRKGIRVGISKESYEILNKLIKQWRIEPMQIDNKEEYLKTLGMAGATLANLIGIRLGLFFKLEKANTPNKFFEALQEITRRIKIDDISKIGKIYPHSLEKVSQMIITKLNDEDGKEFFNTTKNILLIYTSLRSPKKDTTKKENNNE